MKTNLLTPAQANFELSILNAEAQSMSSSDIYAYLKNCGLSDEVAIRLKAVAEITTEIGNRAISVGKVILMKIIEFVRDHPHMAAGIAVGAAIGVLVNAIPWVGPILSPIATLMGVAIGALAGHRLDKAENGQSQNVGHLALVQDVTEIAKAFFELLIAIFNLTMSGSKIHGV